MVTAMQKSLYDEVVAGIAFSLLLLGVTKIGTIARFYDVIEVVKILS